ncbi:hypothetical protein EV715DRAFT_289796 [Schizophyllum commune]
MASTSDAVQCRRKLLDVYFGRSTTLTSGACRRRSQRLLDAELQRHAREILGPSTNAARASRGLPGAHYNNGERIEDLNEPNERFGKPFKVAIELDTLDQVVFTIHKECLDRLAQTSINHKDSSVKIHETLSLPSDTLLYDSIPGTEDIACTAISCPCDVQRDLCAGAAILSVGEGGLSYRSLASRASPPSSSRPIRWLSSKEQAFAGSEAMRWYGGPNFMRVVLVLPLARRLDSSRFFEQGYRPWAIKQDRPCRLIEEGNLGS